MPKSQKVVQGRHRFSQEHHWSHFRNLPGHLFQQVTMPTLSGWKNRIQLSGNDFEYSLQTIVETMKSRFASPLRSEKVQCYRVKIVILLVWETIRACPGTLGSLHCSLCSPTPGALRVDGRRLRWAYGTTSFDVMQFRLNSLFECEQLLLHKSTPSRSTTSHISGRHSVWSTNSTGTWSSRNRTDVTASQ